MYNVAVHTYVRRPPLRSGSGVVAFTAVAE